MIFLVLCVNKFSEDLDSGPQDFTCGFPPPIPRLLVLSYLLLGAPEGEGLGVTQLSG